LDENELPCADLLPEKGLDCLRKGPGLFEKRAWIVSEKGLDCYHQQLLESKPYTPDVHVPLEARKVRILNIRLNLYQSRPALGQQLKDILELLSKRLKRGGHVGLL